MSNNPWNLTQSQCATLDAMSLGDTAKVTAKKLGLSYRTLENHMHSAMTKMEVPNRLQAHLLWDRHVRGGLYGAIDAMEEAAKRLEEAAARVKVEAIQAKEPHDILGQGKSTDAVVSGINA